MRLSAETLGLLASHNDPQAIGVLRSGFIAATTRTFRGYSDGRTEVDLYQAGPMRWEMALRIVEEARRAR